MSTHSGIYTLHLKSLACTACGESGALTWEDVPGMGGPELVAIEGRFHERLAKKPPHAIELICGNCGAVQKAAA